MAATFVLLALCGLGDPAHDAIRLLDWGPSRARGRLVDITMGARRDDPANTARPTLVVVHGLNPVHPLMRFTIAERYAEAVAARHGDSIRVLAWDWNSASRPALSVAVTHQRAINQGRRLAAELLRHGLHPASIQLVGQSTGCLVVAAAAQSLTSQTGSRVAAVVLCDPVAAEQRLIFGSLELARSATWVEHYWVPGPSGFGRPAPVSASNVHERAIPGPRRWRGLLRPAHTDHLHAVRWHLSVAPVATPLAPLAAPTQGAESLPPPARASGP